MMEITDRGDRIYCSGRAAWDSAHIPGSAFVDLLTDLGPRYSPAVPLMCPLSDFAEAMESRGIGDDKLDRTLRPLQPRVGCVCLVDVARMRCRRRSIERRMAEMGERKAGRLVTTSRLSAA